MKNKKFTIGLTLLMAGSLFLTNCTKNKTNEAPSPDYEVESTQEINRIQMIVSDIHEMGAVAGDQFTNLFGWMSHTPLSIMQGTNTINSTNAVIFYDLIGKYYTITFNNTIGKDGHVRNGVLTFNYGATTTVSAVDYYRQPGFTASVTATGYTVDDYSVTVNGMKITNTTIVGFPVAPNTPTNTNMTWSQNADVKIEKAVGTSTITHTWNGTINKTLLNTRIGTMVPMPIASPQTFTVYPTPFGSSLNWAKAWISYSGQGTGTLQDIGPYNLTMTGVTRNMNSSPETFYSSAGMFVSPERHPFLSGFMTFKPGAKPTRDCDFGAGENVDYNVKVTIEGVSYDVDCK
ncbi:MAG: hypothetical protein IPJ32_19675 [Sphingobacteriaceae bacterium]|nr:hypothetical protein [Sphingobacteriaceae bacterium]